MCHKDKEIPRTISNARISRHKPTDLVADFTRDHWSSVQKKKTQGASYVNCKHDTFRHSPTIPKHGKRQGLGALPTHKSTRPTAIYYLKAMANDNACKTIKILRLTSSDSGDCRLQLLPSPPIWPVTTHITDLGWPEYENESPVS